MKHLSTQQKVAIVSFIISSLLVLYWSRQDTSLADPSTGTPALSQQPLTASSKQSPAEDQAQATISHASSAPALATNKAATRQPEANNIYSQEIQKPTTTPTHFIDTWQLAGENSPQPKEKPAGISEYQAVQLNPHPEKFPVAGDKVSLPFANNQTWVIEVTSTSVSEAGNRSWSGNIAGYGNGYHVVMTYGEHLTLGAFNTPKGEYRLKAVDGLGWLNKIPAGPIDPDTSLSEPTQNHNHP